MSIQWTFIAGYLYFEIAIVIIMIMPIFSPRKWHSFFHSRLFAIFQERTFLYFYGFMGILSLFLMDSLREMRKYSHSSETGHAHLASEMKGNVKLFRAQRNFYITGFAIFLAFVIRRLVTMIIIQYELEVQANKIIKKAEETVQLAKTTVRANTLQQEAQDCKNIISKLEQTQILIEDQKRRIKELEDEVERYNLKDEHNKITEIHGDN